MEDYTDFENEFIHKEIIGYNPFGYEKFTMTDDAFQQMEEDETIEEYFTYIIENEQDIVTFFTEVNNTKFNTYYFLYSFLNSAYTLVFERKENGEITREEIQFTQDFIENIVL